MTEKMLTTFDNPFDPFTQWKEWYQFDHSKGYYTCEYLARIVHDSVALTDEQNDYAIDEAMNEIVRINNELYKIVFDKKDLNSDKKDLNSDKQTDNDV